MAGGKKKKTKPASNPLRGFATTSVQSKTKLDEVKDATTDTETSGAATLAEKGTSISTPPRAATDVPGTPAQQRQLHELSPDELEAQLETSELQQFVEQNTAKVRKDASRQVTRLQTERRVIRGQAEFLSVKDWLPEELMQQILELIVAENRPELASKKQPVGDDLLSKVWTLRLCLLDLDIPPERVNEVIGWVVANPSPLQDGNGMVWGLSSALDWLALHCHAQELLDYDLQKPKSGAPGAVDGEKAENTSASQEKDKAKKQDSPVSTGHNSSPQNGNDIDFDVSDVDFDLEPEELIEAYLRTRARLYEVNPLTQDSPSKKKKANKTTAVPAVTGAGERKLRQKLSKIESDPLFDQYEADSQWATKKISLAREAADRRRLHLPENNNADNGADEVRDGSLDGVAAEAERLGQELLDESEDDEADLLGGMFAALPGVNDAPTEGSGQAESADVTIRDFGKLTGMSPKRILEETCKARDPQVKLVYKLVSPTAYASRHSLSVAWSKEQEIANISFLSSASIKSRPRSTVITVMEEATPDVAQSEAYVSTLALFVIFSGSPKEEKAHMRLPPAFRDLWSELAHRKQQSAESADRETIKELRGLIKEHTSVMDDDDDDEVVFNANNRRRLDGTSRTNTPQPGMEQTHTGQPKISRDLMDLWARKTSTPSYQRMLVSRMNLPMFQFREAALEAIDKHQVTILCGETGCGKSTQLPAFILEYELSQGRQCKIYCTEPRRISAISLAQRVSEEMGERKGDVGTARSLIGYAVRLESHTVAQTRLVYATVGIVLRMLERPDGISDITHLIIDEVHERSIDTDFLLIVLRTLMVRRQDLKVVLMSATVDAQKFSNYLEGAPIITVPGRTFPVQAMFLEDAIEITGHTNDDASSGVVEEEEEFVDSEDASASRTGSSNQLTGYSKVTKNTLTAYDMYRIDYSLIVKLLQKVAFDGHFSKFSKAVLIFLPGIAEIRHMNDALTNHSAFRQGWNIHPLHSSFSSEDQQAAFEIPPDGFRKIVLATNIAETGITIPDVTCVIDTGKHKEMRFDERRQLSKLTTSFIARANAKQRRGRAGRVQEGICFHLFTKQRHDQLMAEQQTPEMLRLSLQDLVMRVKICKLGDIEHALSDALDPPSSRNIRRAIDALIEVDALTSSEELTQLGQHIAKLPLDAQLGKFVLLGSIFGCLDFALTAAATMTSKSPFLNPINAKKQADTVRLGYKRGDSDLLTAYNAYCSWRKVCKSQGISEYNFCNKNFLSSQNLANIEDLKGQLLTSLVDSGFVQLGPNERAALSRVRLGSRQRNFVVLPEQYCRVDEEDSVAQAVLAWSFYPKVIQREGKGWRNIANNQSLGLHPSSVNKHGLSSDTKLLSFYSIMQGASKFTNAQETTPVPELALVLLAGDAVFHPYAGAIIIDGNRLRYKVRDWKTMVVLKTLRGKLKEVLSRAFRNPGKELAGKYRSWMEIVERMFELQRKGRRGVVVV